MPYVRKHGNQVAIVHGERDSTGTVQQRVLFSLYSRPEAEAALGSRQTDPPLSFHGLLQSRYEGIRFDWKKIDPAIAALKDELPDRYEYPAVGVAPVLRAGLVGLLKGLLAANPQTVFSAGAALNQQRRELLLVRELIDVRLRMADQAAQHRFNRDNEFGWLARSAAKGAPPEAWEWLDGMESRGEGERAEACAGLLVEAWPEFADGYNALGTAALDRKDYEAALAWFARAMEVGRKLFPKRIASARWWTDVDTRPYIRAMRNTALTLSWSGRYAEVLPWCDCLANECRDTDTAAVYRSSALLNLRRWQEAREAITPHVDTWPEEDFVAAFASFELGDRDDALARWLHAAIQRPRAARMLVGGDTRGAPNGFEEVEDHNAGVHLVQALGSYLKRKAAVKFFGAIMASPEVGGLTREYGEAVKAWHAERGSDRSGYDRMIEMATSRFARVKAGELRHLLGS